MVGRYWLLVFVLLYCYMYRCTLAGSVLANYRPYSCFVAGGMSTLDVDVEPELEKKADLDLESPQRDVRQSEIEARVCVRGSLCC